MAASNDYQVTFTLNGLYTGTTEADNFTIIGKHCDGSPADTTIATGVSASDLTTGITYTIANTISGGTITSTGDCTNSVNWTGLACEGGEPPTPTATPNGEEAGESSLFKVSRCLDDQEYLIADDISCIDGNGSTPPNPSQFTVGQYVQFAVGTDCPHGATYCGIITAVQQSGTRTAVLTMNDILNQDKGCTNVECAE